MAVTELTKQEWVLEYSTRILKMWQNHEGPLGTVDEQYIEQLKKELDTLFDDPLIRQLIETTY